MAEKGANALVEFGADDVLEFASVRIGFRFGDRKCVGEQPFCETTAANDVARAMLARFGECNFAITLDEQAEVLQARDHSDGIFHVRFPHAVEFGRDAFLIENPVLFEDVIVAYLLFRGHFRDLREASMREINATVREASNRRIVRHH